MRVRPVAMMNFADARGGAVVVRASSALPGHAASNMLVAARDQLWLSKHHPEAHWVVLRLGQPVPLRLRGECNGKATPSAVSDDDVVSFGLRCWHLYTTNPASVDISVSTDGDNFQHLASVSLHSVRGPTAALVCTVGSRVFCGERRWLAPSFIQCHVLILGHFLLSASLSWKPVGPIKCT